MQIRKDSVMTVSFSIFKRVNSKGIKIYSARFFDESHKIIKTAALRFINKSEAVLKAASMLNDGIFTNTLNPDALEYVKYFWTRDSEYVIGRSLRSDPLSESYIKISASNLKHIMTFSKEKSF